ncbi:MAG: hypothetical protein WC677_07675 [Clostridia bacterium]|jgi:hypothetical protein
MLFVSLENTSSILEFHVGGDDVAVAIRRLAPRVNLIQADGYELNHIRRRFTVLTDSVGVVTIPIPDRAVAVWFGDIAKTIVANW